MNIRKYFKYVASRPEFAALTIFIVIAITFYIINENFLNFRNLRVLLTISPEIALIAMGATILMVSGEFDLSVGSVFALSGVVMVVLTNEGVNAHLAFTIALLM